MLDVIFHLLVLKSGLHKNHDNEVMHWPSLAASFVTTGSRSGVIVKKV